MFFDFIPNTLTYASLSLVHLLLLTRFQHPNDPLPSLRNPQISDLTHPAFPSTNNSALPPLAHLLPHLRALPSR